MPEWSKRFRSEEGVPCIDLRVRRVEQLFDHRDPAPFQERDLDDDAADYLVAAVEELPARAAFKIVVWINEPLPPDLPDDAVSESLHRHFASAGDRVRRRRKAALRRTRLMFFVALIALVVLLTLAELIRDLALTGVSLIPESLTILAWVLMWRPLDSLLFDWFPYRDERRLLTRIERAPLEVRAP